MAEFDWREDNRKHLFAEQKIDEIRNTIRDEVGSRLCAFDDYMRRKCETQNGRCWCEAAARAIVESVLNV